ncbi:hypothetical protein CAEBREN_30824 [Caenorhabditis brenneri]|uniref:C2H2-type domain-containing protein n=1 Tax=Caenorhabditis brenneri TaxID=135651 RepID=G0NHB0_CAEBE|nr:hypothetical protein CAEBREN_30824 [Caenorhabditis brenneri]
MTCDDLNKFIQVNIYGRTLQELSKQGIVLESLLNDIGCSKVWIGEGCMYNSPDSHNTSRSTESNSKENALIIEQAPVLSTTYATINCPRFSTPAVENRVDLERKFTLNLPQKFSRINPSFIDKWIDEAEQSKDVEDVLHELVEKVVKNREQFSTTITKVNFPRYSTPIHAQEDYADALNIPDAISEIATDGEEEMISVYGEEPSEERTIVAQEEKEKTVHRGEEEVVAQGKRIKQELKSVPLFSPIKARSMRKRPVLSRCVTEIKPSYLRKPLSSSHSARPKLFENENLEKTDDASKVRTSQMNYSFDNTLEPADQSVSSAQLVSPARKKSENVYYELKPMVPVDHVDSLAFQSAESFLEERRETPRNEMHYDDMDYGDNNHMRGYDGMERGDTMLIDHYEEVGPDADDMDDNESDEELNGDDVDDGDEMVIMDSDVRTTKKVSFAKPLVKRARAKDNDEWSKLYIIKCYYTDCKKTIHWKPRYGKRRLLDHAFSHCKEKFVECSSCEFSCQTTCQMRYHYRKVHADIKMSGFAQKRIVGIVSRRKIEIAQQDETEIIEVEEEEREQ